MKDNDKILRIIGNNIKSARTQKGYTQGFLSEKLNTSDKFISMIERGESGLSINNLVNICEILDIEPNSLFNGVFKYNDNKDKYIINSLSTLTKGDKEWQEKLENEQKELFWKTYINMADELAEEHSIIVMDTLRKKETLEMINKLVGNNIMLLYIDAKFEYRVSREYKRLNKEGSISYEQVKINTLKKDKEKERYGLIQILNYLKEDKMKYGYIIYNNGTIEDFKKSIDSKIKIFLGG